MLTFPEEALPLEGVVFSTWVCTSPLPETLILAWPVPTLTWADPLGESGTGEPLTVTSTAGTDGLSADAAGLADAEVSRTVEWSPMAATVMPMTARGTAGSRILNERVMGTP